MPIKLYPARLDDGSGIEKTLRKNKAQYHVSCRLLFNNTKLERAEKRSAPAADRDEKSSSSSKIPRRTPDPKKSECLLCEEEGDNLCQAMTMTLNKKINECATTLNDGTLLAKLSAGDVVAQDMKYHKTCLAALYNRKRAYLNTQRQKETEEVLQGKEAYPMAFSEMLTYINEMKTASLSGPLTF